MEVWFLSLVHRCFSCHLGCASTPPRFTGSPSISTEGVVLVWDEPDIMDPLVLDRRYALYTMCDGETNQILQADDLQGPSLTVTGLPANTRCSALVVMYSRHCDRNLTGPLVGRTTFMTAAGCEWTLMFCSYVLKFIHQLTPGLSAWPHNL